MPPRSKKNIHMQQLALKSVEARKQQQEKQEPVEEKEVRKADVDGMVLHALATGNGYSEERLFAISQHLKPPSSSSFYRHQAPLIRKITDFTSKQCDKFASQTASGSDWSIDTAWNHPKNGSCATTVLVDQHQNKVIAYESIEKKNRYNPGNFVGSSNMMESAGVSRCITKVKPHIQDKQIRISHDHDNKSSKIFAANLDNYKELRDPGHALQEFKRNANSYFDSCARLLKEHIDQQELSEAECKEEKPNKLIPPKRKAGRKKGIPLTKCKEKYHVLIQKLCSWYYNLVLTVEDEDEKRELWLNSKNHLLGNHENCKHGDDEDEMKFWVWKDALEDTILQEQLENFLEMTTPLLQNVSNVRTQINESINASIGRTRPKHKNFNTSNEARACMAINKFNFKNFVEDVLINGFPDPNSTEEQLIGIAKPELTEEEEFIKKEKLWKKNQYRRAERARNKSKPGDYKDKKPFCG